MFVIPTDKFVSTFVALLFLFVSSAAFAQKSNPQVSDKELAAFASAYTEVQRIRSEYEPSLKKSKDPKESQRLQAEANGKLKQTLAKHGLTIDRYNQIYAAVNANEDLRRKTLKMVEQDRKKS